MFSYVVDGTFSAVDCLGRLQSVNSSSSFLLSFLATCNPNLKCFTNRIGSPHFARNGICKKRKM